MNRDLFLAILAMDSRNRGLCCVLRVAVVRKAPLSWLGGTLIFARDDHMPHHDARADRVWQALDRAA
ncbi:MAG: hypothetical protein K2X00_20280 [Nitrospiraceae bacterium]|nr:hypothetical protein [Nitrospiraceae bacterium]